MVFHRTIGKGEKLLEVVDELKALAFRNQREYAVVSFGLGSTGWLKSILAGAIGVANYISKDNINVRSSESMEWNSDFLYYTVREPFPSKISKASLVFGTVSKDNPMTIVSQMPENGVIFSDGIEADFLEFNSGTKAHISVAEKKGLLVV